MQTLMFLYKYETQSIKFIMMELYDFCFNLATDLVDDIIAR